MRIFLRFHGTATCNTAETAVDPCSLPLPVHYTSVSTAKKNFQPSWNTNADKTSQLERDGYGTNWHNFRFCIISTSISLSLPFSWEGCVSVLFFGNWFPSAASPTSRQHHHVATCMWPQFQDGGGYGIRLMLPPTCLTITPWTYDVQWMKMKLDAFLTSATDKCEWCPSCSGHFTAGHSTEPHIVWAWWLTQLGDESLRWIDVSSIPYFIFKATKRI